MQTVMSSYMLTSQQSDSHGLHESHSKIPKTEICFNLRKNFAVAKIQQILTEPDLSVVFVRRIS